VTDFRCISVKQENKKQRNTDGQRLPAGFHGIDSGSEGLGFESQRDHSRGIPANKGLRGFSAKKGAVVFGRNFHF
jgi:hypothetical protein